MIPDNVFPSASEVNSPDYISALKRYLKGAEGTWYYDGIYNAHTDVSRFFGWLDYIEGFGEIAGSCALDVGCGSGGMPIAMLQRGAARVCGLEVDKALYEICSIRFETICSAGVYLGDGAKFPFESDYFDVITSIHVIEHVKDIEGFMAEIFRVMKKGGKCIVDCPNRFFPVEPHNEIPFITYLPKKAADLLCSTALSRLPFLKADLRLRLKNVASFAHFISRGQLARMINEMGGRILMENPVERFLGDPMFSIFSNTLKRRPKILKFLSRRLSRNAMIIFTK